MKQKTNLIVLASLALLVLLVAGCSQSPTGEVVKKQDTIKLGVIAPLTGPASEYGTATQQGLDLAVEEINAQRGITGREIELVYEDGKCESKTSLSALQKLSSADNIKIIIGTICSSVNLAYAPVVQENNILVISSGASNYKIADYDNIFRTWPSDALQGKFLAKYAYENLGLRKVGVIYINNDYGKGQQEVFQKEFERLGGEIIALEAVPESASDVRTQLLKLKAEKHDGVLLAVYAREAGITLKQAKELGFKTLFFGGDGLHDPSLFEIAGDATEGLIASIGSVPSSSERTRFLNAFETVYSGKPRLTADAAYDIPYLLREAMKTCKENDVNCIKKALIEIKYKGASGMIDFDENGDLVEKEYEVYVAKNNEFVLYEGGKDE